MAELKRLLRRLDGLDARRAAAGTGAPDDGEQRDYVGTLRGAPDLDEAAVTASEKQKPAVSARSAALLAAVIAGLISTATVYVLMSAEPRNATPTAIRPIETPAADTAAPPATPGDVAAELVRSAALLAGKGNIEGARELLRRAAELGSGPAALELARTYDPSRATPSAPRSSETDSALARAWYERARELGMAETGAPLQGSGR